MYQAFGDLGTCLSSSFAIVCNSVAKRFVVKKSWGVNGHQCNGECSAAACEERGAARRSVCGTEGSTSPHRGGFQSQVSTGGPPPFVCSVCAMRTGNKHRGTCSQQRAFWRRSTLLVAGVRPGLACSLLCGHRSALTRLRWLQVRSMPRMADGTPM